MAGHWHSLSIFGMQRKIVSVDGKELEVVKVDGAWMRERYEEFRLKYFSEIEMPTGRGISLVPTPRLGRVWGRAYVSGWARKSYEQDAGRLPDGTMGFQSGSLEGRYVEKRTRGFILTNPKEASYQIRLNTVHWLPEVVFEGVLVHEMVHIACYRNRLWQGLRNAHDGWFRKFGEYVTEASGGKYRIERYVSKEDIRQRDGIRRSIMSEDAESGWAVAFKVVGDEELPLSMQGYPYMWYWIPRYEQVNGFLARASMGMDFLDTGRSHPFSGFRIDFATVFEVSPDNVENPGKIKEVGIVKRLCLPGNPASAQSPNPPITERAMERWAKLTAKSGDFMDDGVLRRKETLTDLFRHPEPKQGTFDLGESLNPSLDLSDEQRLEHITESLLGRMASKAIGKARNWLYALIDKVKSSLWNDEVEVVENEDGTVTIGVS